MKRPEEAMEILEAFDLTGTLRGAAALAGCDHKTVARLVAAREAAGGGLPARARSRPLVDPFAEMIDELVDRSRAQIRADKAHAILVAMGYEGSYRTTRRAVAEAKRRWRQKHGRRTRPWIPQPGLWLQWDYGDGPVVAGTRAVLFCAWLAWSRFRVVVPLLDKTLPSVVIGLDRTLRLVGGVPAYALTDNEKTVTVEHVCGIAVRNATIVEVSRHYGLTIQTCEPADPQSKGGSEATVKIAKADLVPTDHNLREEYADWQALEQACQEFMADVNTRPHRATRQPPVLLLEQEHEHLHRLPRMPHTLCFGQTGKVDRQSTVSVGEAIYSVPHELIGERVWVRAETEQLVVVHVDEVRGPREVARHQLTTPGRPAIDDGHYPPKPAGALDRKPRARSIDERAFLALAQGAERWQIAAAAAGTSRVRRKMAEAIDLSKLHGTERVERALRTCADAGRFADGDLASILHHQQATGELILFPAPEDRSLQRSTRSWEGFGR
ncbi:MAG: IS21 family transposase [Solirubrobacteraceae bacterium]